MQKALCYDDVFLMPRECKLTSRKDAVVSRQLGSNVFKLPVVPANMVSTINYNWAKQLDQQGYFYVMHRFNNTTVDFVDYAEQQKFNIVSISTGVSEESAVEINSLKGRKVDYVTIDIAHGHSRAVSKQIELIKRVLPNAYVIAGNVATSEGAQYLEDNGADAVKVGIGSGVICTTKLQTGFHIPMFTCIQDCVSTLKRCSVIADGGVRYPGDITKALVAGADMVMAGGIFAGCSDSPAGVVDGKKVYYGSTSLSAKQRNDHIEGRTISIDVEVDLHTRLHEITQALQSSVSYAGGYRLCALNGVEFKIKA